MRFITRITHFGNRLRVEYMLPFLVMISILAITGLLSTLARINIQRDLQIAFDFEVRDASNRIDQRIQAYEQVLRGARGLFNVSEHVTRGDFRTFVESLELSAKYPGIQGVGFSLLIPADQKDEHIAAVRADGFPEYNLRPEGRRDLYTSIIYLEPFSGRNLRAFGYDMYSEPTRRTAMERAKMTGQCAMSGKVKLVQETETDVQAGFLMYLPVYRGQLALNTPADSQRQLLGWVYEPFRMNDLMENILGQYAEDLDLEIYDGDGISDETLLYRHAGNSSAELMPHPLQTVSHLDRDSHRWTVLLRARSSFKSQLQRGEPQLILVAGSVLSLLLAFLVWLLIEGRKRAIRLADQRETRWKQLMHQANDAILLFDPALRILEANDRATQYLNYSLAELQEMGIENLYETGDAPHALDYLEQLKSSGATTFELNHRRKDGSTFPAEVSASTVNFGGTCFFLFVIRDIIDRKQTEDAQQRFERLFRNNPALMALSSLPDGMFLDVNEAFLLTLGYASDEVVGKSAESLDLFVDKARQQKTTEQLTAQGRINDFELQVRCKDGSIKDGIFSGEIVSSLGKQYLLTVMLDITGRKRATEEIRRQSGLINSLLDSIPDIIFFKDINGVYLGCNPPFARFVGRSKQDIVGKSDYDLFGKNVADFFTENDRLMLKTRQSRHNEEWITYPDGRSILIDTLKTPYWGPDGNLIGVLGISRDITERKRAEAALQESESNFRTFFESMTDMIVVATPGGRIVFTNSAVTQKLGYSAGEISGMSLLELHPPEKRHEAEAIFAAMMRGERDNCPLPLAEKSGALIPVETRIWSGRWNGAECIFGISKDLRAEQEAQQRFERLFRSNPALMALSALPKETFLDVNDAFLNTLGYAKDEVIGKTSQELELFVRPGVQAVVALELQIKGRVTNYELQVRSKDGTILDGIFSGEVISSQGKQYFLTVMVNITERKKAEEELKEERRRLASIIKGTNVGTWEWNIQTGEVVLNEQWAQIIGHTLEDLQPICINTLLEYAYPEDAKRRAIQLERHFKEELDYYEFEFRMNHTDGRCIWTLDRGCVATWDTDGKPLLMSGTLQDITERKRAEEALRESEERHSLILESAAEGIYGIDTEGNCTFCNSSCLALLGYAGIDELIGKNMHWLIHHTRPDGAHFPVEECAIYKAFQLGENSHVSDELFYRSDGSYFPAEYWSYPQSRGETIVGAVVTFFDITERKQAEADLRSTNAALEQQTQLATEMASRAEMANVAKSEFLANMSHEIRTPMNGVIGMTGLLLDTELDEEQRRYAESVRRSGESLLALINDILDFSKIEAGKLSLELLDFDLESLLEDLASILALRAHEKGLEFLYITDSGVPSRLHGDPGRLRQILTNLAGNAIKFTQRGEVAISVSVNWEDEDAALLRFSVRDTGIGVPANKTTTLFEKFTQADASTTRQYGGTGLGLAISKQLAELMEGEIGVRSEEHKGSEFWFTARLQKQRNAAPPVDVLPQRACVEGVSVLVVDDNLTNRDVLVTLLRSWKMNPTAAPDGLSGLQHLLDAANGGVPFQIAILDMQMPGMSGESIGKQIKSEPMIQDTKLVMMTSFLQRGDAGRLQKAGFAAYLSKPIRRSDLLQTLILLCGGALRDVETPIVTRRLIREIPRTAARILVAEDNPTNQQVALGFLRKLGYSCDAVADGQEALRALEVIPYDLVLMDVQMPVMDGMTATRAIRQHVFNTLNPDIPIVAMTAHAMQGDRDNCIAAGMNDYISKPVTAKVLGETLEKWLPQSEEAGASTNPAPADSQRRPTSEILAVDAAVFDRDAFMERMVNDMGLARRIAAVFLEDIPQRVEELKGALECADTELAQRQAHSIKGAAATISGERLRQLASQMERATQNGNLQAVLEALPLLEQCYELLRTDILGFLDQ